MTILILVIIVGLSAELECSSILKICIKEVLWKLSDLAMRLCPKSTKMKQVSNGDVVVKIRSGDSSTDGQTQIQVVSASLRLQPWKFLVVDRALN